MRIAHLADIQIRNFSRHDEYLQSFENLYQSLREKKPDRIVIVGDIAHTKTQISPEFVDICAEFFTRLAKIAPLDLTLGNHDGNLKNPSRLDAITPIVKSLNNPRIRLYKQSKLYNLAEDYNYIVLSCFGSENDWLKYENLSEDDRRKINIVLFHGTVDGVRIDNDFILSSPYKIEMFNGFDYVMLGDIHRTTVLDQQCRIAYPGSYPQQSYAEATKKGYFLWDIESKEKHELEFVELPNVCPYYTIVLDSTLVVPTFELQKNARIRIISPQLNAAEEKDVRDQLDVLYAPIEVKIVDEVNVANADVKIAKNVVKVENLRDVSIQELLIQQFLKDDNLDRQTLEEIYRINKKFNAFLENEEDVLRNVRYRIKSLKFNNLFSFGKNNILDYDKLSGINGIFGRNAVGKSSLAVDVPLYCMFNKISKEGAVKNNLYINDQEENCDAEITIQMGMDEYYIKRNTSIYYSGKKTGNVEEKGKTDVIFTKTDSQGTITNYTGEERSDTDQEIKKVFGTPEDFMITAVAPQFELVNFLKNRATDRKKIIGRYFDLDIFEKKYALSNDELKTLKKSLKMYEGKNFELLIQENVDKFKFYEELLKKLNEEYEGQQASKSLLEQHIWSMEKGREIVTTNISNLLYEYETRQTFLNRDVKSIEKDLSEIAKYPCIRNPDCCLRERETSVKKKLELALTKAGKNQSEIDDLKFKCNEAKSNLLEDPTTKQIQDGLKRKDQLVSEIKQKSNQIQSVSASMGACKAAVLQLQKEQDEFNKLKREFDAYHYYTKAMGKDGISYNIISDNLHVINSEIKKILGGAVNFDITLEDEDKEVNIYFKHENNNKRLIELCSGMEKTVAAIAIRGALMSITTLPVPNIIVFDEIFDSLDSDNLDAVNKILHNLKRLFEIIFVITHSDTVKDICDNVIFIERDNRGYARIN